MTSVALHTYYNLLSFCASSLSLLLEYHRPTSPSFQKSCELYTVAMQRHSWYNADRQCSLLKWTWAKTENLLHLPAGRILPLRFLVFPVYTLEAYYTRVQR